MYGQSMDPFSWLGLPRQGTEMVLVASRVVFSLWYWCDWLFLVFDQLTSNHSGVVGAEGKG